MTALLVDGSAIPAVRLKGVQRGYALGAERLAVLRGIDLEVPAGQMCAVMGPSGVGKSTLLHCIAGLDVADGGQVEVLGHELTRLDDHRRTLLRRARIGIIYQFFNLVPTLTARENVLLPYLIEGRAADDQAVDHALERVGMAQRAGHLPSQLSGGEMQLVSIARAIVRGPGLVLGDEPTGNLNVATGRRVMALLAEVVHEASTAMLLVTHNPEDAARADRVVFLKDGVLCDEAELCGADVSSATIHARLRDLGI